MVRACSVVLTTKPRVRASCRRNTKSFATLSTATTAEVRAAPHPQAGVAAFPRSHAGGRGPVGHIMSSLFDRSASIDRATLRSPHPLDGTRQPRGPVPWGIPTVLHVDYRIALQGASTLEDVPALDSMPGASPADYSRTTTRRQI